MAEEPRFPGIEWFCDLCGAPLNTQKHFSDHKYIWKCTECGYKNSISWDNIEPGDSAVLQFLLHLLGFISFISLWTAIMLGVSLFALGADHQMYFIPFLICAGTYAAVTLVSVVAEYKFRSGKRKDTKVLKILLRNIKEDILAPLLMFRELVSSLLSLITRKKKKKKQYVWHNNKAIVIQACIYTLLFVAEIAAFIFINHLL